MTEQASDSPVDDVLDFWFGPVEESGLSKPEYSQRWYKKDADFDREIVDKFGLLYEQLSDRSTPRAPWLSGPRGLLAAIIVLDQFSRNMFRDSKAMYAADSIALSLSFELIALGLDPKLPTSQRAFAYLPLMHAERLDVQERCVALFTDFAEELGTNSSQEAAKASIDGNVKFAIAHRDIVARFGRFPHRNNIIGRSSTEEELAFLKEPGSSF